MENGDIVDENIMASSEFSPPKAFKPWKARLNGDFKWMASSSDSQPWIQADIGYQTHVSGVVTQGEGDHVGDSDWIKSIKVSTFYMTTSDEEIFVKDLGGEIKVNKFLAVAVYNKLFLSLIQVRRLRLIRIKLHNITVLTKKMHFHIRGNFIRRK